jgi:hypothetical protein
MSALKDSMDIIASPLTHIINLSISSGIVPDLMKIARVVPLFKSGDHRLFQNYRPISIIPIFSKLLERVVHKRILDYININNSCIFSILNMASEKTHSTS